MGALGSSNTAATFLLVWDTYEALQRRHSVKWCAVDWGQRFSNLAVLVGLVNFVIVKGGTHVYLVLGENVRKEGKYYTSVGSVPDPSVLPSIRFHPVQSIRAYPS